MNTNGTRHRIYALWLALLLVYTGSAVAFGQEIANSEQASNKDDPQITTRADTQADLKTALPNSPLSKEYKIGVNDVLTINVWHEPDLSRNLTVRPDGKITLPLIGDVRAAGKTPPELEAELSSDLAAYIKDPELTVIVAEIRSRRVNVIGQVVHPGAFALTQQMGVLDLIAEAGGLRDFAKKKKIYVLRETSAGVRERLKYDYKDVLAAKHNAKDILLQPNDTVVVP
ncbi:MAG TPA: polysaccharide biosynthesis/export family protein [Acidobacteriaceae bacterium]|nr:polysaccharide biosynthesis/export family protein [Acidobacteriaceae bacterium]